MTGPGKLASQANIATRHSARARSSLPEVRNPILRFPAVQQILTEIDPHTRHLLGTLLRQLGQEAKADAEKQWRSGKGMMAAYSRVVSVDARHIAHAIDPRTRTPTKR